MLHLLFPVFDRVHQSMRRPGHNVHARVAHVLGAEPVIDEHAVGGPPDRPQRLGVHQTALHGLAELASRHHHDLDLVIGRGEFGFNGRPRWRIARRYPGIPDRVHLREIRHVRDPNIGRE